MKAITILVAMAACTPSSSSTPPPTPFPDDADAAPVFIGDASVGSCEAACAVLKDVGCSEGRSTTCVSTMTTIDQGQSVRTPAGWPLTCAAVALVRSVADAHTLGIGCSP